MKRTSTLAILAIGLVLTPVINSQASVIYDQSFDPSNNIVSANISERQADDFVLSENADVNNITIWGSFWSDGNLVSPNFQFDIGTSLFGDEVFSSSTLIANTLSNTGLNHNDNDLADIYEMSFDLGQEVSLSKDITYYLSITSIKEPGEDPFAWQRSDSSGIYWIHPSYAFSPSSWYGSAAFQLNHFSEVPEPNTFVLLGFALVGLGLGRKRGSLLRRQLWARTN